MRLAARHYQLFHLAQLRSIGANFTSPVYVSYRKGNQILLDPQTGPPHAGRNVANRRNFVRPRSVWKPHLHDARGTGRKYRSARRHP